MDTIARMTNHTIPQTHTVEITQTITVDVLARKSTDAAKLALAWSRVMVDQEPRLKNIKLLQPVEQKVKVLRYSHPADCEYPSCDVPF